MPPAFCCIRKTGLLFTVCLLALLAASAQTATFTNPILSPGPDPWVIYNHGFYYFMCSTGNNLTIRRTRDITDLAHAKKFIVWTPPSTGMWSKEIWAPELHRLRGKWYIYFAADDGANENHRIYVIENDAADPTEGSWSFRGKVADPSDKWAIDPTILEKNGADYLLWSGWAGDTNGVQSIYIARLKNPWTIEGTRALLSTPQYPWEKVGDLTTPGSISPMPHVDVNEGPEILQHGNRVFLTYSASGCWTDYYELGLLALDPAGDPMNPSDWKKSSVPVFRQNPSAQAFGTGHNGFFHSPDGREDWIIYHANPQSGQGCDGQRSTRIQPFSWTPDGFPDFGRPVALGQPLPKPSGTP